MSGLFGGGRDKGAERRAQQQQQMQQAQYAQERAQMQAESERTRAEMAKQAQDAEAKRLQDIENNKKQSGAIFGTFGSGSYLGSSDSARNTFLGNA